MIPSAIVAVVAAVIAAVVVSRPGSDAAPAAVGQTATAEVHVSREYDGDRRTRLVEEYLQRKIAALKTGDEAGWLAGIETSATKAIAFERTRFANLRQFPFASFDLHLSDAGSGQLFMHKDTAGIIVEQISRLSADIERSKIAYDWTLRFAGDTFTITDTSPSYAVSLYREPLMYPPFDNAALRVASAGGVTVAAGTNSRWNPRAYLPAAQRAAALVRSLWGKRPYGVPGFVVFLADHQQFTKWYDNNAGTNGARGFTVFPQVVEPDGTGRAARPNPTVIHEADQPSWIQRSAGARIVLDMTKISGVRETQTVMAHEMAHAVGPRLIETFRVDVGARSTSLNQATWPIEGFARWVEFLDKPGYAQSAMNLVRAGRAYRPGGPFPASSNFYATDGRRQSYNYNLSSSMFLAAQQTGDRRKAVDLYICLTNQREYQADTELFINNCISGVGLNPDNVWASQRRLTR